MEVLAQEETREGADHELLWSGYLVNYSGPAVSKALQRLKRRGLIESTGMRGWWRLSSRTSDEERQS